MAYPSLREGNTSCGFPAYVSWRAQKNEGVTIGNFKALWVLESVAGLSLLLGAWRMALLVKTDPCKFVEA